MDFFLTEANFQASFLAAFLLEVTAKGLLLTGAAFFLSRITYRKYFQGSRYWFLVLSGLVVLGAVAAYQPFHPPRTTTAFFSISAPEPQFSFAVKPIDEGISPLFLITGLWLAGITLHFLRIRHGLGKITALSRGGSPLPENLASIAQQVRSSLDLRENCEIRIHPDCSGPMTFYTRGSPWIILPLGSEDWDADALRAAFTHEMVHIRRKDFWWSLAGRGLSGLFWFLPPVWFLLRRFRLSQEMECDRAVIVDGGVDAENYAAVLLNLSRKGNQPPVLATAMGTSSLEVRIMGILFPTRPRARKVSGLLLLSFLSLSLGLGLLFSPPLVMAEPNFFRLMQRSTQLGTWAELDEDPRLRTLPLSWPVETGEGWMENCRFPSPIASLDFSPVQEGVRIYADHNFRVLSAGTGKILRIEGSPMNKFTVVVAHSHGITATYSSLSRPSGLYPGKNVYSGTVLGRMSHIEQGRYGFEMSLHKEGKNMDPGAFIGGSYVRLIPPVFGP